MKTVKERTEYYKNYWIKNHKNLSNYYRNRYLIKKEEILNKNKLWRKNNKDKKTLIDKNYQIKNKKKIICQRKKYYLENKERILKHNKNWRQNHKKDKALTDKIYREKNKEKIKIIKKIYRKNNKEYVKNWMKEYVKRRKSYDPEFKILVNLRNRLYYALKAKNIKKSTSILNLIGCNSFQLKKYLEKQFDDKMCWNNYGLWHIDHKKPCAYFDLCDFNQQQKCFHYTNLQPMWASENIKKGSKYNATTITTN